MTVAPDGTQNLREKRVQSRWRTVGGLKGQLIGRDECPVMRRWFLETPLGSVRLHHFLAPDDTEHLHDHPWAFLTFVFRGGYDDVVECWRCSWNAALGFVEEPCPVCGGGGQLVDRVRAPAIRFRPAEHRHAVRTAHAWSLVLTGPERRAWGFWVDRAFRPVADYFTRYGYAPCGDVS